MTTVPSGQAKSWRTPSTLVAGAVLLAIVGLSLWIRWPGFTQGGFGSHDVGGILYNAMVLRAGGLPYVDTIELKAPGTFYLAAAGLAGPSGHDIAWFQVAANAWAMIGLFAVAGLAWRWWGPKAACTAAALYALHDAFLDSLDGNYVTWTGPVQILAIGAGTAALRARGSTPAYAWWCLAGVLAGFAALLKQPAGVVLVPLVWWAATASRQLDSTKASASPVCRDGLRPTALRMTAVVSGFGLAHVPIALHYVAHGALGSLTSGYVFNPWGHAYVTTRQEPWPLELVEGALATTYVLMLPLLLAAFVVPRRTVPEIRWLTTWAMATLAAAFVGFRFYKGYFVPVAPALCLLAAAPWGLLGARTRRPWWMHAATTVIVLVLVLRQAFWIDHVRDSRIQPRDTGARIIANYVAAQTNPGDTIWIWGWHLWGVYALADRMSASRVYKSLGLLTPPNDNTWRRPGSPTRFVDGPAAAMLLADFREHPPAYIVLGSTVPHREFTALRTFLREHYRRDRTIKLGRVQFWRRRDGL